MRKAAIAAAVAAALAVAGCGSSSTKAAKADPCPAMWHQALAWSRDYNANLGSDENTIRQIAKSYLDVQTAKRGITCTFR